MITQGHIGGSFSLVGSALVATFGLQRSLIKISNFSPLPIYARVLQPDDTALSGPADIVIGGNQAIIIDKPDGYNRIRMSGQEPEARVQWQHVRVLMEY